jgi:8-oxo-dGTP pyrophosphatase MutT (NUDIX family)
LMNPETPASPRPAATVLIVRDGGAATAESLEVLMVRRSSRLAFGASAWVFPGGAVSAADHDPAWEEITEGGVGVEERAVRIAAVRESFEEAGILVGCR